ncbi:MAG: hypothetical protein ABIH35_03270 [Patescibacteria group bacterium]
MKKLSLKKIFGITTMVFTVVTAVVLLLLIWEAVIAEPELRGKIAATSITLAALSFVLFLVASFDS